MTLSITTLSVSLCWKSHFIYCHVECRNVECHYAECRYAEYCGTLLVYKKYKQFFFWAKNAGVFVITLNFQRGLILIIKTGVYKHFKGVTYDRNIIIAHYLDNVCNCHCFNVNMLIVILLNVIRRRVIKLNVIL